MLWMCACECICMLVTTVVCGCCRCCCRRRHYSALSQAQPKCDPIKLLCFVTIPPLLQCTRTREHSPRTHTRAPRKNGRLCYVTFAIVVITWNRNSSGAHQHTHTCNRVFTYTEPSTPSRSLGIESFTDTQITTRTTTTTTKHWKKPTWRQSHTTSTPCQWVCVWWWMCLAGYVDSRTPMKQCPSRYECGV